MINNWWWKKNNKRNETKNKNYQINSSRKQIIELFIDRYRELNKMKTFYPKYYIWMKPSKYRKSSQF